MDQYGEVVWVFGGGGTNRGCPVCLEVVCVSLFVAVGVYFGELCFRRVSVGVEEVSPWWCWL